MPEIITIIVLVVVFCIAWLIWTERKSKKALDKDALEQAWREMPDDPHYVEVDDRRRWLSPCNLPLVPSSAAPSPDKARAA
jgi:hypothetical protein